MNAISPIDTCLLDASYLRWLRTDCGYLEVRRLPDGRWAAIWPRMFNQAILVGPVGGRLGVDNCWCYPDFASAKAALDAWDGQGEPLGWYRHPPTGRRRAQAARHSPS